ncbi:isoleucine--tRNA ligase [Flavitalea sp. BT771]|uniref:isoleucine--tRNA ligase n=1 Tax=Flavitalea sp. BT771 TaxID=3063329 RepID=UPI0026E46539|nr:isoleucine--tRNA ligase [Flavitalea sp. BT771]MDO6433808.1 isoleucine--tRNA ligase [Flavitalea sp. BT771]MDV6222287.1 isoleucine--tRNA ligase [Flavitalea sp. BT771]
MPNKYKEYQQLNLPAISQEILAKWEAERAFERSVELRAGATPFVFYEGPPSANGMPGIHHVISRTLKDLVCRYKTMKGFQVKRKGGWDTHGLPVELGVEKMLGITKEDIGKKISIAEYNETCRREVLKYKDKWDELTRRMGYWVDLKEPYITFQNEYIETLWWILNELYNKDLLYESVSIQPYSPAAGTGLSSHELNQPGTYKDVKDTSAVVMFKAIRNKESEFLFKAAAAGAEIFFMAWTTTPWTLPSNLGLTVGPNIDYVLVKTFNPYTHLPINIVLAKALVSKYFKPEGENIDPEGYKEGDKLLPWTVLAECKGKDLEECRYEQLLPYEANAPEKAGGDPFRVILGDFVTTEDGTGIVHTAPAFGADDFKVGKKYNIGILVMVDRQGKFIDGLGEFSNRYVKNYKDDPQYVDVNVDISVKLKKENRAFKIEKYEHNYPHCWRTDKPILYYPLDAWFIRTTALKDRMVELNKTINWKPRSTGEGRFGNWLENMVDWNLSRSRYWGTPLPIWRTEDGKEEICIGSIAALRAELDKSVKAGLMPPPVGDDVEKYIQKLTSDLHKPFVDEIIFVSPGGKPMRRVPDLIDVWFDSGAMPYAQWHFPFENIDTFAQNYPADFIAEGVDQTRGWFYTLHALAALLKESIHEKLKASGVPAADLERLYPGIAYKTVVSNGLVLDKNGNKMSKRLGNVVDPFKTIGDFGADATRWYLITNASPWDSMKFDIDGIKETQRKFFGTLYNTYQFFALYANVDGFNFQEAYVPLKDRPEIDRWILSSLNTLIAKVGAGLDDYEPTVAGRLIEDFVDEHLSNWYVRLSRRRFWKGDYGHDKLCAYQTLYECLETVARLMAPVSPFFADWLFCNLNSATGRNKAASIHHTDFPEADESVIDVPLEERMQLAQDASSLVLSLRKKVNIKVRQPLQKVLIPVLNPGMKHQLEKVEDLVKAEVNVKELQYLSDGDGFIKKKIKPNFIALGKKLGSKMKAVSTALGAFSQEDIAKLEKEGIYTLSIESEPLILKINEVEITSEDIPGWVVAGKDTLTVALDVTVTPELAREGNAREFVNRIQKIRKDNGYELTDRILVKVADVPALKDSLTQFNDYICSEILADSIELVAELANGTEIEVNDILLKVFVSKKA